MAEKASNVTWVQGRSRRGSGNILRMLFACCVFWLMMPSARGQFGELVVFESPGNTTYYLDAQTGDDENPGTRPESAWRTLGRVNTTRFGPGDAILIKSGTVYHGKLRPKGSGLPGRPITIDTYGEGPRPAIHAEGKASAALLLENSSAWHVKNLELTNKGEKPEAFRYGVSILAEDIGEVGDFKLVNLYVHEVNGAQEPGMGEGAAIICRNRGMHTPTRIDGLLIEGCIIENVDRHGLCVESGYPDRNRRYANLNVAIHENTIENVAGDGIRLSGCDNAIVEYNRIVGGGQAESGDAGGIALSGCDNALVQFNEVVGTRGRKSGAFRCGGNSRENTFQFNFSRDNAGAMMVVSDDWDKDQPDDGSDAGNAQTTMRYNISQDDGGGFALFGPVADARLYNNTVYTGPEHHSMAVRLAGARSEEATGVIANNVFFTRGVAELDLGAGLHTGVDELTIQFQHNAYFGEHPRPEGEVNPVTADPMLVDPGTGVWLDEGVEGYQTLPGSPLRGSGVRLPGHGRYDFGTHPVPVGAAIDIGAYQASSDNPAPAAAPSVEAAESAPQP